MMVSFSDYVNIKVEEAAPTGLTSREVASSSPTDEPIYLPSSRMSRFEVWSFFNMSSIKTNVASAVSS